MQDTTSKPSLALLIKLIRENSATFADKTFYYDTQGLPNISLRPESPLYQYITPALNDDLKPLLSYLNTKLLAKQWSPLQCSELLAPLLDSADEEIVVLVLQLLLVAKGGGSIIEPKLYEKVATLRPTSENWGSVIGFYVRSILWAKIPDTNPIDEGQFEQENKAIESFVRDNIEDIERCGHAIRCLDFRKYQSSMQWQYTSLFSCSDLYLYISCIRVFHHEPRLQAYGSLSVVSRFAGFNHDKALKRALECTNREKDFMLHDYVVTICSDADGESPNSLQNFRRAFQIVIDVILEGPTKDLNLPTDRLCSTLSEPRIFQENYDMVHDFALRLINNHAVSSYLMPVLAEKFAAEEITEYTIVKTTEVLMQFLFASKHQTSIEESLIVYVNRICSMREEKQGSDPDFELMINSTLSMVAMFGGVKLQELIARRAQIYLRSEVFDSIILDLPEFLRIAINGLKTESLDLDAFPQADPIRPELGDHLSYPEIVQELMYLLLKCANRPSVYPPHYASLFEELLESPLLLYLRESGYRPYVPQYIVSKLSRLFSWEMVRDTNFIQTLVQDANQLYFSPEKKPLPLLLKLAEQVINSRAVQDAYAETGLTPVEFDIWKDMIYFVPLDGIHGVTVFAGSVLINLQYSAKSSQATVGFLITLLHESAHLARKVKDGKYDIEQKTPRAQVRAIRGLPGNSKYQDEISGINGKQGEGGIQFECTLFGVMVSKLSKKQIAFLQVAKNWNYDLETFKNMLDERGCTEPVEVVDYGCRTQTFVTFDRDSHLYS